MRRREILLAGMAGNLVATALGIVALTKSSSNKWMAVTGVVVNGVELGGVLILMLLGAVNK